jgi:gluconate 2-dehydrogenase alpha chain
MKRLKSVDVVIVGAGWAGLAMAKEIGSRTSLSVVALERGPARKTSDYAASMDELDYAIRLRMMQNTADETYTHRHAPGEVAVPVRQHGAFLPGSGVGGSGEHWSGMAYRFPPDQFTLATHLKQTRPMAALPKDLSVQDWGVSYEELEPYYHRAEQLLGISGKAGNLRGERLPGGNIFEGPRSSEYPAPPLKTSYLSSLFQSGTEKLGYHPYPIPAATLSEPYRNPDGVVRPGCAYCGYCERFGCMVSAKAQPTNTLLPVLARHHRFTLRTGAWVRRIVHHEGRAQGVQYSDLSGAEYFQPAEAVVLASWTLNNVRLLYLSQIGSRYKPAERTGTLGRNLTHQSYGNTNLFFDKPLNAFMGTGALGMAIADFDADRVPANVAGVVRGGSFLAPSFGSRPIASFGILPSGASRRSWGAEWKKAALSWVDKAARIAFVAEHLAYASNFMDLDPTYTDKFGDPLLRLTLDWNQHESAQMAWGNRLAQEIGRAMGAKIVNSRPVSDRYDVTIYQTSHIQGGAIMGVSPDTSVVSPYLQHWDIPNLWILGASSFPQNASGNPTLTVLATTQRVADAFISRYLKRPGALV